MGAEHQTVSKFEVEDHVARITLNRPAAMNSLNPELRWELSQHWDEVERNDDIWLAVVTGAGDRAFSAGADLKHRAREREADTDHRAGKRLRAGWRIGAGAGVRHHYRRRSCGIRLAGT
jgi:enoyl-CoA hydratase/carnithine racemase